MTTEQKVRVILRLKNQAQEDWSRARMRKEERVAEFEATAKYLTTEERVIANATRDIDDPWDIGEVALWGIPLYCWFVAKIARLGVANLDGTLYLLGGEARMDELNKEEESND